MGARREAVIEEEEFGFMIRMEKCVGMVVYVRCACARLMQSRLEPGLRTQLLCFWPLIHCFVADSCHCWRRLLEKREARAVATTHSLIPC